MTPMRTSLLVLAMSSVACLAIVYVDTIGSLVDRLLDLMP